MTDTNETTSAAKPDLSHLANMEPVKLSGLKPVKRGRQPGSNPLAGHVRNAFESGDVIALPVTAGTAKYTERVTRRAVRALGVETGKNLSISVQMLTAEPTKATGDDVVPLSEVAKLPADTDVWMAFEVTEKAEKADTVTATDAAPAPAAPADPFSGQSAAENGKGKGRKVAAVSNP